MYEKTFLLESICSQTKLNDNNLYIQSTKS